MKGQGKLMWKPEFAAQWARWQVVAEGGGKEYQVPNSAWWVNADICERVLGFPSPEPIFYEHIMIDGKKMSASLGNVVYPKDWLECAPAELLRFFYNKRLMKTRSFSWKDLPVLYADYEKHADVYFGKQKAGNEKEAAHMKRLFEISQMAKPKPVEMAFGKAVEEANTNPNATGKVVRYAKKWMEKHCPESRIVLLDRPLSEGLKPEMRSALRTLSYEIADAKDEQELSESIWAAAKASGDTREFFKSAYMALTGKEQGPKLAQFIMSMGRAKVAKLLEKV
jgi:lysyl-tRNA synthetase class 1